MMAVAPIIGGALGMAGSLGAGYMESQAADNAAETQWNMYSQTRKDLLPYMNFGQSALTPLGNLMGLNGAGGMQSALSQLQNYPGYQWAFNQGLQGVDRSAASRGLLLSGGQLKDTTAYGQGMADQLFGTYYNQLMGVAGMGENAAAGLGQQGTQLAGQQGMYQNAAGQDWGNAIAGAANNFGSMLSPMLMDNMTGNSGYNPDSWMNAYEAGGAMGGIPEATLSDRRAKTDIRRIGKLDSGLPVYSFRLKGSGLPQMGVMADEVRKVAPHAVRRGQDGLDRVNYRAVSQLPPMRMAA